MDSNELDAFANKVKALAGDPVLNTLRRKSFWTDLQEYFIELFNEKPDLEEIKITRDSLISDMEHRFKESKYDARAIAEVLENGYGVCENGDPFQTYLFKRTDFIRQNLGYQPGMELPV